VIKSINSVFSDRRNESDRRRQDLPMPAGLDRRALSRRSRHFQAQPWWLSINYAVELVSEKVEPVLDTYTPKHSSLIKPPASRK
jgi:hypothetical protein